MKIKRKEMIYHSTTPHLPRRSDFDSPPQTSSPSSPFCSSAAQSSLRWSEIAQHYLPHLSSASSSPVYHVHTATTHSSPAHNTSSAISAISATTPFRSSVVGVKRSDVMARAAVESEYSEINTTPSSTRNSRHTHHQTNRTQPVYSRTSSPRRSADLYSFSKLFSPSASLWQQQQQSSSSVSQQKHSSSRCSYRTCVSCKTMVSCKTAASRAARLSLMMIIILFLLSTFCFQQPQQHGWGIDFAEAAVPVFDPPHDPFAGEAPKANEIILGICRVPFLDQPERLTGLMIAIDDANKRQMLPNGYTVRAAVFYYPHCSFDAGGTSGSCDFSPEKKMNGLAAFIGNFSKFHAVLFPHFNISDVIIDHAKVIGLPVVDPNTIRLQDYELPNLFLMEQAIETEISVVIRYMLMAHSCANTGVVHESQPRYAEQIKKAFAFGGYNVSKIITWPNTQAAARDMFFGAEDRKCVVFLTTSVGYMDFISMVYQDPRFVVGDVKMFSWSQTSTSVMRVGNPPTSAPFTNFFFPKTIIPTNAEMGLIDDFRNASQRWANSPSYARDVATHYNAAIDFIASPTISASVTASGVMWYFRAMYAIKLAGHAVELMPLEDVPAVESGSSNANSTALVSVHFFNATKTSELWAQMLHVSTYAKIWASDFPFFPPIRACPPKPLPQVCSCNIVTRVLFMLGVEGVKGTPYFVNERPLLGETNVAHVALSADKCVFKLSVSSYPFRVMQIMDEGLSNVDQDSKTEGSTDLERMFFSMVSTQNFADPAPIRPWRLISASFPAGTPNSGDIDAHPAAVVFGGGRAGDEAAAAANAATAKWIALYKPFMLLGTSKRVTQSSVLSVFSNSGLLLEDLPLRSREDGWNPNILQVEPPLADYIHAVANYYANHASLFTSIFAIAATSEEMRLIIKSLHTLQINMNLKTNVAVSTSAAEWDRLLTAQRDVRTFGPRPFVIVSAVKDLSLLQLAFEKALSLKTVTVAMATAETLMYETFSRTELFRAAYPHLLNDTNAPAFTSAVDMFPKDMAAEGGDILFASPYSEHWVDNNPIRRFFTENGMPANFLQDGALTPTIMAKATGFGIALQLSLQAINFKDAGELLYTSRTASVADISFGPFSNETCEPETIRDNEPDRSCQCSKAIRQLRVHSMYNRLRKQNSERTRRYSYTMSTCGVKYGPLLLPEESNLLRTVLIAALVGGFGLLSIFGAIIIYVCCFTGRNNRLAPKDSSKPFAIVFTDIQSSTTLWSRCPAIMSDAVEQHCDIIRKLIRKHDGYEVKTIGDSFMVAFKDAEKAVLFSLKVQEDLYKDYWPAELDQHYREIIEAQAIERMALEETTTDGGGSELAGLPSAGGLSGGSGSGVEGMASPLKIASCPNAPSDEEEYARLWNGIRVRVGTNYGLGEIRKDLVSLGYDYFGTVVNTAARVEGVGHGGQVLATDAVLRELPSNFFAANAVAQVSLGPQYLRGLDDRVVLTQLLPAFLAARLFPGLRLDVENVLEDEDDSTMTGADSKGSGDMTVDQLATRLCNQFIYKGRNSSGSVGTKAAAATGGGAGDGHIAISSFVNGPVSNSNNNNGGRFGGGGAAAQQQRSASYVPQQLNRGGENVMVGSESPRSVGLGAGGGGGDGVFVDGVVVNANFARSPSRGSSAGRSNSGIPGANASHSAEVIVIPQLQQEGTSIIAPPQRTSFHYPHSNTHVDAAVSANANNNNTTTAQPSHNFTRLQTQIDSNFLGVGGAAVATNNNTSNVFSLLGAGGRDFSAISELIAYYRFMLALMSTSTDHWRRDLLKHLAKRWRIPHAGRVGAKEQDADRLKCMMNIAIKAMIVARSQRSKELKNRKNSRTHNASNNPSFLLNSNTMHAPGGSTMGDKVETLEASMFHQQQMLNNLRYSNSTGMSGNYTNTNELGLGNRRRSNASASGLNNMAGSSSNIFVQSFTGNNHSFGLGNSLSLNNNNNNTIISARDRVMQVHLEQQLRAMASGANSQPPSPARSRQGSGKDGTVGGGGAGRQSPYLVSAHVNIHPPNIYNNTMGGGGGADFPSSAIPIFSNGVSVAAPGVVVRSQSTSLQNPMTTNLLLPTTSANQYDYSISSAAGFLGTAVAVRRQQQGSGGGVGGELLPSSVPFSPLLEQHRRGAPAFASNANTSPTRRKPGGGGGGGNGSIVFVEGNPNAPLGEGVGVGGGVAAGAATRGNNHLAIVTSSHTGAGMGGRGGDFGAAHSPLGSSLKEGFNNNNTTNNTNA